MTLLELPYPIALRPLGFVIHTTDGQVYPLYLLIEPPERQDDEGKLPPETGAGKREKIKHMIMFEQGVVLLDKNIQYLLFISRHPLVESDGARLETGNTILNL